MALLDLQHYYLCSQDFKMLNHKCFRSFINFFKGVTEFLRVCHSWEKIQLKLDAFKLIDGLEIKQFNFQDNES